MYTHGSIHYLYVVSLFGLSVSCRMRQRDVMGVAHLCRSSTNLVMDAAQKIIPFTMTIVNEWGGRISFLKFELIIL